MEWSWLRVSDAYKRCRDKSVGRKLGVKTYIVRGGKDDCGEYIYELVYCHTSIVRWFSNGEIAVRTAGWYTRTTRRRLDQFARVSVETLKVGKDTVRMFCNNRSDAHRHSSCTTESGEWAVLRRTEEGLTYWAGQDGKPLEGRLQGLVHRNRAPKRNPFTKMCVGDVFLDSDGVPFIAMYMGARSTSLVRYLGDPVPGVVRIDYRIAHKVTDIFALSMLAGGWTLGERYEGGK